MCVCVFASSSWHKVNREWKVNIKYEEAFYQLRLPLNEENEVRIAIWKVPKAPSSPHNNTFPIDCYKV